MSEKNNDPNILRNMPHGLHKLFGTGDNGTTSFKEPPEIAANSDKAIRRESTMILPPTLNPDNLFDPDKFVSDRTKIQSSDNKSENLADPVAVEFAAFGPNCYNQNNPKQGQTAFNADYYYAINEQSKNLSKNNLYVGGIPAHYMQSDLLNIFKEYGNVTSVFITRAGGIAFVEFEKEESAQRAIAAQNNNIPPKV
ncbi:ELAV-like protein 1, partial [Bonamia ostreae]